MRSRCFFLVPGHEDPEGSNGSLGGPWFLVVKKTRRTAEVIRSRKEASPGTLLA